MELMPKSELKTMDNDMLLRWLTFLSRYHAEDIGLHVGTDGSCVVGERRPSIDDVQDELVTRGLDSRPAERTDKGENKHEHQSHTKRGSGRG